MSELPYKIAVLCYLFNQDGQTLLIKRHKKPNRNLYSPIGGKLEMGLGESPAQCAQREIEEETGLVIDADSINLNGMISEKAFNHEHHWLMFLYEVTVPVDLEEKAIDEGELVWVNTDSIMSLEIPETDKEVIWPLFWKYRNKEFFAAHIDCSGDEMKWSMERTS